jgi:hypothetical protein
MTDRFRRACLVGAVIIGCACSAFQILHDVRVPVQFLPGVAARVNGRSIDMDSVNRTVAGMDARVRGSEAVARHAVLGRMIDEELLVQHALDSGAAESNPEVRAALVRSAITRVNSEAAAEPVSEAELSAYFDAHKEAYATAATFDVTPLYFDADPTLASAAGTRAAPVARRIAGAAGGNARARAAGAKGATAADDAVDNAVVRANGAASTDGTANVASPHGLRSRAEAARAAVESGTPIEQVASTADALPFASPGSHVTPRTLANYFGPALADAIGRIATRHTTEVTQLGNGAVFIYLNNKTPGEIPSLASIHDLVAADALRDRQDQAMEALLASLRQSAHIEFATSPNPAPPVAASR